MFRDRRGVYQRTLVLGRSPDRGPVLTMPAQRPNQFGHMVNPQRGTEPSTEDPRETPSLHRAGQADRRSNSLISLRDREPKEVPQTTLPAHHCRVYCKVPVFWHESRGVCLGGSARDSEFANSLLQGGVTVSSEVRRLSPHFDCCRRSTIPTPSVLLAVACQSAIQPRSRENRRRAEVLRRAKT